MANHLLEFQPIITPTGYFAPTYLYQRIWASVLRILSANYPIEPSSCTFLPPFSPPVIPELRFREAGAQWVWGTANCMAAYAATLDSRATPGNTVGDGYLPSPGMTGGGHAA